MDVGQACERVDVERLELLGVGRDDAEEIVGLAHHPGGLDDLRYVLDGLFELDHRLPSDRIECHPHDWLIVAADSVTVELSCISGDHADSFEVTIPSEARRGAEANSFGQIIVRYSAIALELAQDCAIDAIHSR